MTSSFGGWRSSRLSYGPTELRAHVVTAFIARSVLRQKSSELYPYPFVVPGSSGYDTTAMLQRDAAFVDAAP